MGAGTTAEIWLPRAREAAVPASPAAPPAPAPVPPRRVLVVDDDALVAAGTAMMLEDLGHRTVVAEDGAAALRILSHDTAFDLVLTDQAMPGMTGLELAERLRVERPGLPVALATGYAEIAEGTPAWLSRLNKPYSQADLAGLVARLTRAEAVA